MNDELKDLYDSIALLANISTIFVYFKNLKLKYPVFLVHTALKDEKEIEVILQELFLRKQVTWEQPSNEDPNWCINSLKDLRDKCDIEADKFLNFSQKTKKYLFFATLLRTYGSYADESYKNIMKLSLTNSSLKQELQKFRKQIYPIITTLLFSLPDGNILKNVISNKLEFGCENSGLKIKQILPTWTIEN